MPADKPCRAYADVWRVGPEWLKTPDRAVCPRCGYTKEEHTDGNQATTEVSVITPSASASAGDKSIKLDDQGKG